MAAFNISVVNSCKFLAIRASRNDNTSTQADIVFTYLGTGGGSYTAIMNYDAQGKGNINVPTDNLPVQYGVYRVCIKEQGIEYGCKPALIKCDIDCCLTKLTDELLDCSCDCPKCALSLAKAQKVFLLIQAAIESVNLAGTSQSDGYYLDILSKYNKAKEICDTSCGCDC